MDRDILIGLFVLALVVIEVANVIGRNRGTATMWTLATQAIKESSQNTQLTDLVEKAMVSVVPSDLLRQQVIGGTQDVGAFIKRLAPDDLDAFIDQALAYQKTILDGKPNVPPPPSDEVIPPSDQRVAKG